jgi:hypothetical protein
MNLVVSFFLLTTWLNFVLFNVVYCAGRMEALAICSSYYIWCGSCGTKTPLGGLCRTHLGDHTVHVSSILFLSELSCIR